VAESLSGVISLARQQRKKQSYTRTLVGSLIELSLYHGSRDTCRPNAMERGQKGHPGDCAEAL